MPPSVARRLPAPARQPRNVKRLLLITFIASLALLLALSHVLAAISLSATTPTTQNFDSIGTAAAATLPADFRVDRTTTATSADMRKVGTYAAAGTATTQVGGANLGTSASNGIYNFGSGATTTGADRAIGFLASGTATASGNIYAQLVNNTGGPLTGLQISYDVEKYRGGSNPAGFRIQLYYSLDGTTWTAAGSNFTTSFTPDASNAGYATAPGATVPVSNQTLTVAVPSGSNVYLAWNYSVSSGSTVTNAQALAVDNISILAIPDTTATPTPTITPIPTPTPTATPTATPTPTPTPTNPTATGSANPNSLQAGSSSVLTVSVTPGANPASSGVSVTADLSSIGGLSSQPFSASGNTFTYTAAVAPATSPGVKSLPVSVSDAQGRTASTSISLTVEQPPPPADHIVISQIYGGGGNSGATYTNDYVELYNPTSSSVTLTGWSIQYSSATGSAWTSKQPLGGDIGPGQYYLVQLASGGSGGSALPVTPNIAGDINMSGTTGKVALVSNGNSLTGGVCPIGTDPDIVDFVGYGTTANCHEGGANAPAPSNSTAIFRSGAGSVDTNQNGSDFATGTPAPRRTAPVVELGPWVASSDPISDGTTVPHDATITVNFSEAVNVDPSWFNINCASSGQHNEATISRSPDSKSYAITPNANFQFGEQCTVTIQKDAIHDQDTDDSAPNTDTLFADYSWSFTVVAAGQPAPYTPDVHLTMGNPSNAVADVTQPDNYLMMKPTYATSYNRSKGTPNWVSWHLTSEWYGTLTRVDTFRADPAVPADWYRVQGTDYQSSGFDRGHMTPNADRDNENRIPINQETYLMSNMVPQAPDNNQGPWANLENYLRTLTDAGNEIYIVSGPLGVGGTGSNGGVTTTIAGGNVTVPAYTWKVALVLPKQDGDDVSRVTASTRVIAILMPNTQGIRNDDWHKYLTTVDNIEQQTGYNFFSNVPAAIQNSIEAGTDGTNPPGTADESASTNEDTPVNIALSAVSPDANANFTYTVVGQPAHGTLSGTGANRVYTPAPDYNGADSFTFKANDGHATSNTSTVTITVNSVNDAPVANNDSATTDEDTSVNISVLANDTDTEGDALTVTAVTQGAHGSVVNNGGVLNYAPAHDYNGPDSFTYTISDGNGGTATGTVSITINPVNDAPAASDDTATIDEDGGANSIAVLSNDTDVDGDSLTVSAVTQGAHGSVANGGSSVSYTPAHDFNGTDSFTYTVSDGHGGTATATVHVTVNAVNDAPVSADDAYSTDEDTPLTIAAPGLLGNDSDVDSPALTAAVVSGPSHGTLSLNADGSFSYSPAANYNGADSFTYKASDGALDSAPATVHITVNSVNDAPVAVNDNAATDEDTAVNVAVLSNDTDVDGDTLSVASIGSPAHGAATLNPDGTIHYTPAPNYNGADSFTYVVGDGHDATSTGTVNVTVNSVNDAPVASAASASTDEDNSVAIQLSASDVDNDSLTFSVVSAPAHGSVSISGGVATYTPAPNYNGADSFTFKANDGQADSNAAGVSVTINPVNDAPTAGSQSATTDEDTPKAITLTGSDVETPASSLVFNVTAQPAHGHLTGTAPNVTYVPDANYDGGDSFAFTVTDAGDGTAPATTSAPAVVSINVNPVNDAPTLAGVPATATISELAAYAFSASAADVDTPAQTLTFSLVGAPAGASINPSTGAFTWTPSEAQGGTGVPFAFKVRVSDGVTNTDADIVVTVAEVNQSPTLDHIGAQTVNLGNTLSFAAVGHDSDVPVQSLTYSLTGAPAGATIDPSSGAFSWTPTEAQAGHVYTFGVRVTDNGSPSLYAEEQISVGAAYTWGGVLAPLNGDGSSVLNGGRTVPVKFSLTGASAGVTDAVIRLRLFLLSGGVPVAELPVNTHGSGGNLFSYTSGQYQLNWDTSGLSAGSYQLVIDAGDGVVRAFNVTIR